MTTKTKEQRTLEEINNCGKPISYWCAKTGQLKTVSRMCKRWSQCPRCAAYKKEQFKKQLIPLVNNARFLIVSKEEEAKITRQFKSDNIRRVPLSDNNTAFIIDTDKDIGTVFTKADCELMSDNCIPDGKRRMSGKLGTKPEVKEEQELEYVVDFDEIEKYLLDPEIEVIYREFRIEFDESNKEAPRDIREVERLVRQTVELPYSPTTEGELQEGLYILEQAANNICEAYGLSFNFISVKKTTLKLSEVDWHWLRKKPE